jgi:PAS domain S-box-containing protein
MIDPHLYQLLVEQTRDYAVFILDPQGRIMTWSAGAERIKGYTADEIIGRHFSTFYTRDALESGWPAYELKVATAEGRFEDEGWRVRKDGSRFWANVIITALRDEDGKLLGFSKITRDLTERKLHEEALRQSEERFRLLIEGVVDYAIYMLDPEGIVTSWNTGAQRIKGYTREEINGKHFSRFFVPEDIAAGRPWEELATARRLGRAEVEGWRVRKDGSRFWARVVVTALYDAEGHLRGYAKVTQDLTTRRHLVDLEQAAKNVSDFIAVLAHELRNPLAPIRNALQVMAQTPPTDPSQKSMRDTIERQSAQLARILDDMLDIARITRGSFAIESARVDLSEVVRNAAETSAPSIQAGKHRLEVSLAIEPLIVLGDVHRLAQLVSNVLNNAARYTAAGGVITVTSASDEGYAVLRVKDTGRGIEPELVERIFDMFVQGRPPIQRIGTGLGIGLALARRIAELHGGTLTVASEGTDKGSEFTLRLPLAVSNPRAAGKRRTGDAATPTPTPPPVVAARRVLVVDDNEDAAMTLSLLLKSLGHETAVAYNGPDALKLAGEFRPDVVLLDIGLPGIDGYEVARRIRTQPHMAKLKIIAVTGWGQESDREKSREAGFDLHLVKPVDLNELAKVVSERNGATLH